jgi:hypothetical protein
MIAPPLSRLDNMLRPFLLTILLLLYISANGRMPDGFPLVGLVFFLAFIGLTLSRYGRRPNPTNNE